MANLVRDWGRIVTVCVVFSAALGGCGSSEALRVRDVAAHRLECSAADAYVAVSRKTPMVREWIVGCDFVYTRVHCADAGCYLAEPIPPCFEDVPCLEENPLTLRWELPDEPERASL